ncbi:unnamed protein product [Dovyalis caffra]|uniref:Uncharacterized protein n=1 Tax=Dovyalis caffra TaxID=77055 RepID=A0AAV1STD8_9ROSI|nr:unnamed protein product [Dovyalis caffra]
MESHSIMEAQLPFWLLLRLQKIITNAAKILIPAETDATTGTTNSFLFLHSLSHESDEHRFGFPPTLELID